MTKKKKKRVFFSTVTENLIKTEYCNNLICNEIKVTINNTNKNIYEVFICQK